MKKSFFAILFLFIAFDAIAQSSHTDPRVMKGLDASAIPVLKSYKDLSRHPGDLTRAASPAGKAEFVYSDVPPAKNVEGTNKSLPNDFSLWKVERAANGTANWMWRAWTKPQVETTQPLSIKTVDGLQVLQGLKQALRIADPQSEFVSMSSATDELGYRHLRYAQYYKGVPVWNRDLYVHFDASGEPYIINGTYEPTPKNVNITPLLTDSNAISAAIADLKSLGRWAPVSPDAAQFLGIQDPSGKLVLYPSGVVGSPLRLAYEVSVSANLVESYFYIIDASSGEVITKIDRECSMVPTDPNKAPLTITHFAGTEKSLLLAPESSGFVDATGVDLNGVTQNLRTYQHTDGKYYAIWDLPSINIGASKFPDQPSGGAMTMNLNNQDYSTTVTISHNTSSNNKWSDPAMVSAHHNNLTTYNYYSSTFNRKAIDDQNGTIVSIIHATQNGTGMDNAFWSGAGKVMIWGDGNTEFKPLAGAADVAGHEMTHGVINNTANLVYQFQSGALNESMADVFGVMVDTRNLTIGEDIMLPGTGTCLRDLGDPHNAAGLSHQPANMSEFNTMTADQDNGGVHTNSGIPSRACAILINQLGRDKVQKMYYRALTMYLTRSSQFTDCRNAVQSAAKDLFGANGTEFNDVGAAFDAVGITGPGSDPNGNDIPAQTGGSWVIAFSNGAGNIGLLDPIKSTFAINNTAVARVSGNGSFRAQLTAPRTGQHIWFVDQTGHLSYVEVATGNVFNFPTLNIQADGDLWNAAIAPDESIVALTSSYANDPNIYLWDSKTIFRQPLTPETTDGGALATIDYPDVIAWSPSASDLRIGFDAFNDNLLGGSTVGYWSMYEINYNLKKTYDLIASQPQNVDVGNIAYSNTSPDIITFNALSNSVEDVGIADFKTNTISLLGVPQLSNNTVQDGDKPSFSPDDKTLTFASQMTNAIYFDDLASNKLSLEQFTFPVYKPYWFVVGGSAGVASEKASVAPALEVYPSTVSSSSTINFKLPKTEDITLDIVNLFGETVRAISKEQMGEGDHEITFSADGLASGNYFIRLLTPERQDMTKIIVKR